jgi:hypothetical protein
MSTPTVAPNILTPEKAARLQSVQGYVMLIRKPGDPAWYGPCENSFSLSTEKWRTFFFWSSLPDSGEKHPINGLEWLRRDLASWKTSHPDWLYTIFDARDEGKLPVILNWEHWLWAHTPDDTKLAGIRDKYYARNIMFRVKSEFDDSKRPIQSGFTF